MRSKINSPVSVQEVNVAPAEPQQQTTMTQGLNLETLLPLLMGGKDKKLDQKALFKGLLPANSSIPPQLLDLLLNGKPKKNDTAKISSSSSNIIDTYQPID